MQWIGDRIRAAGARGAVLGLSGGIDSAVTAVLCQRAFPEATLAVMMPCHSDPQDEADARLLAAKFNVATELVRLDSVFDALERLLPQPESPPERQRLARSNLKVRLRMLVLYYFANRLNYLVVGSSNRSELATGYFTKYGDGAVDIVPLGNLTKTEVRKLAVHLGVPPRIIDRPPSAGLWPGQTDEAELGLTYDEIDRYLLSGEGPESIKVRLQQLAEASRHKRQPPPVPDF